MAQANRNAVYANERFALFCSEVTEGRRRAWSPNGARIVSNSPGGTVGSAHLVVPETALDAPGLASGAPLLDALWRLALADVEANVNERGMLDAGKVYTDYEWVRDTAYSLLLGYDMIAPRVARRCLEGLVDPDRGIVKLEQYEAVWEAWPYRMTDSAVWAPAALRYAQVAADTAFLRRAYRVAAKTLRRLRRDDFDPADGLYIGNSSFFDGHNGYPMGYTGRGLLKTLSNNCVHYAALRDAGRVAALLKRPAREAASWDNHASLLAEAIRREFWDETLGYPIQIKLGGHTWERRFEALGAALYMLFGIADTGEAQSILTRAPATPWGVPTTWPDYTDRVPYHTGSVWPFVAGFWGIAAARLGDVDRFTEALASVARIAALELTFVELMYDGNGLRMGSDHQLWSACGYLGLIVQGLFGVVPVDEGFLVQPCVPRGLPPVLTMTGLRLGRGAVDLRLHGAGIAVRELRVDGRAHDPAQPIALPARGRRVEVELRMGRGAVRNRWTAPEVPSPGLQIELQPASIIVRPGEDQEARYRILARFAAAEGGRTRRLSARWSGGRGRWRIEPREIECSLAPGHQAWFEFNADPVDPRETIDEELLLRADWGNTTTEAPLAVRRVFDLMSEWLFIPRDGSTFPRPSLRERDPMPYWDPAHVDPSQWRRLRVPMPIEMRIPWIGNHKVGWYRRRLHLPRAWRDHDLRLRLGRVGGAHRVFFNGGLLGAGRATQRNAVTEFTVPSKAAQPGAENVIAVRVALRSAPRGIYAGPVDIAPM